jgi:hypothetical protein
MSKFMPTEGRFHDMFLSSAQARLTVAMYVIIIAVMLFGTVMARSAELGVMSLALVITMLMMSYQVNCLVVGNCQAWAWLQAGVCAASMGLWLVGVLIVLNRGGPLKETLARSFDERFLSGENGSMAWPSSRRSSSRS